MRSGVIDLSSKRLMTWFNKISLCETQSEYHEQFRLLKYSKGRCQFFHSLVADSTSSNTVEEEELTLTRLSIFEQKFTC